jgi:hypothetical protein
MVLWLLSLALEITLYGCDILLAGLVRFFFIIVVAGSDCELPGHHFYPFLLPIAPFLAALLVDLDGAAQPPPGIIFPLPRTNAAPTTSSLEACRVAISSSSLADHSRVHASRYDMLC